MNIHNQLLEHKNTLIDKEIVAREAGVCRETIHNWFSERTKPWVIKIKETRKENIEFEFVPVKGNQHKTKEVLHT